MDSIIVNFKGSDFEVFREINREVYNRIESDSAQRLRTNEDSTIQFFILYRENFFSKDLIDFLERTGVDWKKDNEIFYYPIKNLIVIEGWYDIAGKIKGKETTDNMPWNNDFSTTNIFFSNTEKDGIRPELKNFETFRMEFSIVFESHTLLD